MQKYSKSVVKDHSSGKAHASWKSLESQNPIAFLDLLAGLPEQSRPCLNQAFDPASWYFLQDPIAQHRPRGLADPRIPRTSLMTLHSWGAICLPLHLLISPGSNYSIKPQIFIVEIHFYYEKTCKLIWQMTRIKTIFNPFNPKGQFVNVILHGYTYYLCLLFLSISLIE